MLNRSFRWYWVARVATALGFQIQGVAVGWQIYALTHSTFQLGLVGLAQFVPMVVCTLPAGHAADRHNRRGLAAAMVAIQAAALAFLAWGSFRGTLTAPLIFGAVAVVGAARAFERPATQALIPSLVADDELPTAIAWSSAGFQAASIAGPACGGLLYALTPTAPYAVAAAFAACGALLLLLMRPRALVRAKPPATLAALFSGIHFIRRQPVILGSVTLDLFAVLLGGATALLPAYARDVLHTGSWGLGALRAAPALGSLVMSGLLVRYPLRRRVGARMFAAVITFGAATIVFGLSRWFYLSAAALAVLGAADMISVVVRSSLVQLQTPDDMRGRVSAVNGLFIGTSNQLGEFESGLTASWFGLVPATVLGGLGTIVVAAAWMRLFPALRACDTLQPGPD